ncbi:hypothetical protein Moror_12832 [Moniliophthora roreri MCA 2997]|uniref:Uncharacterized protein n=1 Tax=Moniliophthora roreri (strain MCA 2997) TaxID=1381753 RepID=V2XK35_MONRO|nr:hypothetical protein Moror_12832 [Moniliophthora roreri MCA 2997]
MPGLPGKPVVDHKFTFPPFPEAPEGVIIVSFKNFEERGISKAPVSEQEVDALGIPTIALVKVHDTDKCKTDAPPRIKGKHVTAQVVGDQQASTTRKKEWWEEWEEVEHTRKVWIDSKQARSDCFRMAIDDFNKNRKWPAAQTNIRAQWDQFQIYVGSISSTQGEKTKKKEEEEVDDDDDFDDEHSLGDVAQSTSTPIQEQNAWESSSTYASDEKEDKVIMFLNDPARGVQVYLSSYMRKQGLHYADRNLFIIPKLLQFFINYLIRNQVLPGKSESAALTKALNIVDIALVELPLTSMLARKLPDDFNGALKEVFKVKKEADLWSTSPSAGEDDTNKTQLLDELVQEGKLEIFGDQPVANGASSADTNGTGESGWASGGWGDSDSNSNTWGSGDTTNPWNTNNGSSTPDLSLEWHIPDPPTLFPFLGPTTLPMTHQTGIVEWSVKKVMKVTPPVAPGGPIRKSKALSEGDIYGDAEAIESELVRKLARVELVSWLGWEDDTMDPEGVVPRIIERSTGAVVIQDKVVFEGDAKARVGVDATSVYNPSSGLAAYQPVSDTITILVEPHVVEHLRIGMGLGGTWVQLLRRGDLVEDGVPVLKKKAKSGDRFWYMDDMMVTLTSYHIA